MKNQDQDKLLQGWARRQARTTAESDGELAGRISAELRRQQIAQFASTRPAQTPAAFWVPRLAWAAAGALLMLAAVTILPRSDDRPETLASMSLDHALPRPIVADVPVVAGGDVAVEKRVLSELRRVFGPQLLGFADSRHGLQLALGNDPAAAALAPQSFVRVHCALVKRQAGAPAWQTVWQTTAVVQAQERLEIRPQERTDVILSLWCLPLNGAGVLVDSQLEMSAPLRFSHTGSDFCPTGRGARAFGLTDGDTEYQFVIVADVIKNGDLS